MESTQSPGSRLLVAMVHVNPGLKAVDCSCAVCPEAQRASSISAL